MKKFLFLLLSAVTASVFGAMPPDSIIIEAESLKPENKNWVVRDHFLGWYAGKPSKGRMLNGFSKRPGSASGSFNITTPGKYRLWVRYLDVRNSPASFVVSIEKDGKCTGEYEFNKVARKSTRGGFEGDRAVNTNVGPSAFMWDAMDFDAPSAGSYLLKLKKGSVNKGSVIGSRHLDCFLITSDLKFTPTIGDLYPVFVKVRLFEDQKLPFAVHVFGKRDYRPTYIRHFNMLKNRIAVGAAAGACVARGRHANAGADALPRSSRHCFCAGVAHLGVALDNCRINA